jgi:hypothetical protein
VTRCIVIAVFRVIYIARVDLATDILGTMPPTIFLFTLEPNLAILCVSIPMLRPLYSRWRHRSNSSRLPAEGRSGGSDGLRTIGMISSTNKSAVKKEMGTYAVNSTWEMDDYHYDVSHSARDSTNAHTAAAAAAGDCDTGSEKSLAKRAEGPAGGRITADMSV